MEDKALLNEWRRMIQALQKEQGMERREIAAALSFSENRLRELSRSVYDSWDADRITAVLQELRHPFDDPGLVRKATYVTKMDRQFGPPRKVL